jgi:antitoxin MazE
MLTKLKKWGNSQGMRFPKFLLKEAHIDVGDDVNISIKEGKIIIESVKKVRKKYSLKELVSRMPKDYKPEEVDWGLPTGKEEW